MVEQSLFSRFREWVGTSGKWVPVLACLLVIVCAVLILASGAGSDPREEVRARGRTIMFFCKGCAQTGATHVGWDASPPFTCPKCGKAQAVVGFKCIGCRRIIEKAGAYFKCPHCRQVYDSRMVGPGQ